jgi:hypothetical protein
LAEGIPITDASDWLGHTSIEDTHQTQGHLVLANFDRTRAVLDVTYRKSRRQRELAIEAAIASPYRRDDQLVGLRRLPIQAAASRSCAKVAYPA